MTPGTGTRCLATSSVTRPAPPGPDDPYAGVPDDLRGGLGGLGGAGRHAEFDGGAGRRPQAPREAWRELSRVVLTATDPAQPYGAALPWPDTTGETRHRPGRKAGALVTLVDGAPALYVERGGKSLLSFTEDRDELRAGAESLAGAVHEGWLGSLAVERADGQDSLASALSEVLTEAGFRVTPKGLRLRA
ncbi:hypothetical protein [Pseudonocardia sp. ICBG601]|uniref:hypothetical protein n=1 Tax=Pseudonocardia sp. ICBG601 TaxID=2846759 RepID=UPI0035ABB174